MAHMLRLVARQSSKIANRTLCTTAARPQLAHLDREGMGEFHPKIGNRDVVGFGVNGIPQYQDKPDFPCPAVRYGENTPDVLALREKEKGDWKSLSMEEKKALYRASFRLTYSEMLAPTGDWKNVVALTIFGVVFTGWLMVFMKAYVYPPLPETVNEEWQTIMMQRMADQGQGRIEGIASQYDYEKDQWK